MLGIIFSLLALLSWGFGDFSIQRATRIFGDFKTLFYIGIVGVIAIFPFIYSELNAFFHTPHLLILLSLTGVVIFFAALFDFEALKRGKLAIIEPILAIELPITVALSALFWGEKLSLPQLFLVTVTFIGITLSVTTHHAHLHYHKRLLERGVMFAGIGAIVMGLVNFLVGASSQSTSPLLTIWFTNLIFTVFCVVYIVAKGQFKSIWTDIKYHPRILMAESILDNMAWIFYAYAASFIAISVATTISESYIAFTVLLGVFINKEKLQRHQIFGIIIAIASVLIISYISG
ncbi:MAG: DMT family transporter [Patescibacteria group bacterium]|nr:DMT family transporter [Patescibacteria group bacterium]